MNDLIINVAAGLISSVLAPFVVTRLGGGTPPPTQQVSIDGDHNSVTQSVDQSQTSIEVIYQQLPTSREGAFWGNGNAGPNQSRSQDDTVGMLAAWLFAAAALVLAYMFIWPVIVWAFAGAAAGIALMTAWTAISTRGTPGPRATAALLMLLSSTVMFIAGWWTLNGGPGSDVSFARLEAAVAEQHPEFSTGLEGRWTVMTTHPGDILTILGMRGFLYVLTQAGALAFAALLVWARVHEISGWIALHNLRRKGTNRRLIDRAVHFKELGASAVLATLLAAVAICFVTGGWAHSLLEEAQERQTDSIVGTR